MLKALHAKYLAIVRFFENILSVGYSDGIWASAIVFSRHCRDLQFGGAFMRGFIVFVCHKEVGVRGENIQLRLGAGGSRFKTVKVLS